VARSAQWCFRLLQQDRVSRTAHFVTLTYRNDTIPKSPNGFRTLSKPDVQKFFKRLRKAAFGNNRSDIRYYAAGEYGPRTLRPHYHLIIFNSSPEAIYRAWGKGKITVDPVNGKTVAYTTKYICKGRFKPRFTADDRQPDFSLMSKGMGNNYLTREVVAYHQADLSRNYVIQEGFKLAMPRYYRERIFTDRMRQSQNLRGEKRAMETEFKMRLAFFKRTKDASPGAYERSLHESKKAQLRDFFIQNNTKRQKT